MKKIIFTLILVCCFTANAQQTAKLDDFGRIVLNTYVAKNNSIQAEAQKMLVTKLNQITTNNGMGGSSVNPRFLITATVNIGTKDIIAGPPQLIAQNLEVTFVTGDAITNTIFSSVTLDIKGVGTNENKAFIDAFKNINPKNKELSAFLEEGKSKIISYYVTQCDFILKKANTLAEQFKFEDAIYELMVVPETCEECYFKSKDLSNEIFKKKIESDCKEKLKQAKLLWASESNESGAKKVAEILITILPSDNCRVEINKLSIEIKKKQQADEQKKYVFNMLEMQKSYDSKQKQLEALKEIALEQAKNQPKTITYNNIIWR